MASKAQQIEFLLAQVRADGVALIDGTATFYEAGTADTLKPVYLDRDKTTPAANPYTLDGNATAQLYGDGLYKVVIKSSSGAVKYDRDNLCFKSQDINGTYISSYASLTAAIAAIGPTPTKLIIDSATTCTSNTTVPTTIEIEVTVEGSITQGTYSLAINGPFSAPLKQVFAGNGAVTFGVGSVEKVYPQWWGAKGDNSNDDTTAIQSALAAVNGIGGLVWLPKGTYKCTAPILIYKKTILEGEGKYTSKLSFTHTGDGIQSTWPINSSTAVWIALKNIGLVSTNALSTGGGFVDVGGSYLDLESVYIEGFKHGVIFDQTEIATIRECHFNSQSTGGIWLLNGATHTPGANKGFTNNIRIQNNQFNASGSSINIIDDGGATHLISGNNFNAGAFGLRVANAIGLTIHTNEIEAHTNKAILFTGTTNGGDYVGGPEGFTIENNTITDILAVQVVLEECHNGRISNNFTGQATASFISYDNPNKASGVKIYGNSKLITGTYRTAAPFVASNANADLVNENEQEAATYAAAGLSAGVNTVTPASIEGIHPGTRLYAINEDGTNGEHVLVDGITATTFTATFASAKVANWLIYGKNGIETGTWTPVLVGSSTPGTQTYTVQAGKYRKDGNCVTLTGQIEISAKDVTTAGAVQITGLPFRNANIAGNTGVAHVAQFKGFTFPAGYPILAGTIAVNDNKIGLIRSGSANAPSTVQATEIAAPITLIFSATYFTY